MNLDNKYIQFLIKNRISILTVFWVFFFIFGFNLVLIFAVVSEHFGISELFSDILIFSLLILSVASLIFYFATLILKSLIKKKNIQIGKDETETLKLYEEAVSFGNKKYKIFIACLATFIFSAMMITVFIILTGHDESIPDVLGPYIFLGWIIWFPLAWKFFKRKLN